MKEHSEAVKVWKEKRKKNENVRERRVILLTH